LKESCTVIWDRENAAFLAMNWAVKFALKALRLVESAKTAVSMLKVIVITAGFTVGFKVVSFEAFFVGLAVGLLVGASVIIFAVGLLVGASVIFF